MPAYVTLYKLTDQGIKNIRDAPARIEQALATWEKLGGRTIAFFATEGEYDYVAISDAPDEQLGVAFNLMLGEMGNVRSTTMRAYSTEELANIIAKMP
jgi:uncharacterized protein with GYD domain